MVAKLEGTMGKRGRHRISGSEKVGILKRHLVGREEISKLCEEYQLHPNQFYNRASPLMIPIGVV